MEKLTQYDIENEGWIYKKREEHGSYLTIFFFEKEELDKDYDSEYYLQHELRYFKFLNGQSPHILIIKEVCPSHYSTRFNEDVSSIKDLQDIK